MEVLVVDRWNSWVRVWFPDSGEMAWVNLDESDYEPLGVDADRPDDPAGEVRRNA